MVLAVGIVRGQHVDRQGRVQAAAQAVQGAARALAALHRHQPGAVCVRGERHPAAGLVKFPNGGGPRQDDLDGVLMRRGAWPPGRRPCGQAGVDVLVVAERVEGFPVRDGEVTGGRRCGMVPAPLGAPAQLFLVRQCGQTVDGHDIRRQCELTVVHGHGYQGPHPVQPAGAEDLGHTVGSAPGLGDALDLIDGAGGQVADEQQLHDGPGRTADGLARAAGRLPVAGGARTSVSSRRGVRRARARRRPDSCGAAVGAGRAGHSRSCVSRHQLLPSPAGWAMPRLTCQR